MDAWFWGLIAVAGGKRSLYLLHLGKNEEKTSWFIASDGAQASAAHGHVCGTEEPLVHVVCK